MTTKQEAATNPSPTPQAAFRFWSTTASRGRDSKAYDDLLARVSGAVKPADIIEEILSTTLLISPGKFSVGAALKQA